MGSAPPTNEAFLPRAGLVALTPALHEDQRVPVGAGLAAALTDCSFFSHARADWANLSETPTRSLETGQQGGGKEVSLLGEVAIRVTTLPRVLQVGGASLRHSRSDTGQLREQTGRVVGAGLHRIGRRIVRHVRPAKPFRSGVITRYRSANQRSC